MHFLENVAADWSLYCWQHGLDIQQRIPIMPKANSETVYADVTALDEYTSTVTAEEYEDIGIKLFS